MVWIENIQAEWKICAWRARQSVARWLPSTLEGTAAAQLLTVGHFWKRKAGTAGPSGGGWGGRRRGGYRPQSRQSLVPFCFHVYRLELGKLLSNRWGQTVCSVSVFFTKVGGAASPTVAPPVSFAVWVWQWLDLDSLLRAAWTAAAFRILNVPAVYTLSDNIFWQSEGSRAWMAAMHGVRLR